MTPDLERVYAEMQAGADYIAAGGEDTEGALWGWADWLMEEALRHDPE